MSINASPEVAAVFTRRRWRRSSVVWRSRSNAPSTPFIGVRISWLMVARNCDLATLADSAASLARTSDALASSASRPCRSERSAVLRNSNVALLIVRPNNTASTPSGHWSAWPEKKLTNTNEPNCNTTRIRNPRPTIENPYTAVATEPQTITT